MQQRKDKNMLFKDLIGSYVESDNRSKTKAEPA